MEKLLFIVGDGEDSVWVEEESSGRDEDKDWEKEGEGEDSKGEVEGGESEGDILSCGLEIIGVGDGGWPFMWVGGVSKGEGEGEGGGEDDLEEERWWPFFL